MRVKEHLNNNNNKDNNNNNNNNNPLTQDNQSSPFQQKKTHCIWLPQLQRSGSQVFTPQHLRHEVKYAQL